MSAAEIASPEPFEGPLLQEDILRRVFAHLIDSGLHECRRVCRKWRDVCNKLPSRLRFKPNTVTASTAQQFSNVVSLKVTLLAEQSLAEGEGFPRCWADTIADLDLACFFDASTIPLIEEGLVSPSSLRSLSFEFDCHDPGPIIDALRSLSNLTALRLVGFTQCRATVQPVADLQELRSLAVAPSLLANEDGEFILAPTTRLTKLEVLPFGFHTHRRFYLEVSST